MKNRLHTALGKAVAHWADNDPVTAPDSEFIRPDSSPHNAAETYALTGCVALLGFSVCQDLIGRMFEIGAVWRSLVALIATSFFLQMLAALCLPFGKRLGESVVVLLTVYLVAFLPTCPVTIAWLALCGLNFTCWIFQRISRPA